MTIQRAVDRGPHATDRRVVWVLAAGVLDFSLEQTLIVPALPLLQRHYATSPTAVAWTITGFLLALAVSTAIAGRLGDSFGRRRALLISLALFAVGALICAFAGSIGVMIAGRVVQGLGAGVGPLALALARDQVGAAGAPRAVGLIVGAGGTGGVIGFLAAGQLIAWFGVSAIFWALFAVAAGLALLVMWIVPESTGPPKPAPVDWSGALLLATGLGSLMLAISQSNDWGWTSARVLLLTVGAAVLLAGFVARERSARRPLLELGTLTRPGLLIANVGTFAIGFALFSAYALVPLVAGMPTQTGIGLGLDTTQIGLLLAPGAVASLLGGLAGGRLVAGIGPCRAALAGVSCAAVAYLALIILDNSRTVIALAFVPLGLGISLAICALVTVVIVAVDREDAGAAVGVNSVLRAVGSALGVQIAVAVLTAGPTLAAGVPSADAFSNAYVATAVAVAVALVIVALVPGRSNGAVPDATAA